MRFSYRLRRHPFGFWVVTFLLAALTFGAVSSVVDRAGAARRQWGRVESVVVAVRPVEVGAVVGLGDVRVVSAPAGLVPDGALSSADLVVGRSVVVALSRGEVVLRRRLAPDGLRGVAALVPAGMRAVAVPAGSGAVSVRVEVGDWVDVLATVDTDGGEDAAGGLSTAPVALSALVVEVRDDAVTVAVPPAAAARIASALARGTVTLTLTTPGGGR